MTRMGETLFHEGPYLVTTPVPLEGADTAVVNDLSRAPSHLVDAWIGYYVQMAIATVRRLAAASAT